MWIKRELFSPDCVRSHILSYRACSLHRSGFLTRVLLKWSETSEEISEITERTFSSPGWRAQPVRDRAWLQNQRTLTYFTTSSSAVGTNCKHTYGSGDKDSFLIPVPYQSWSENCDCGNNFTYPGYVQGRYI